MTETIQEWLEIKSKANEMAKLHLGCGSKYREDWCNVDYYEGCESDTHRGNNVRPDVWCNILNLSCKESSFDIVYLSHVVEHFYRFQTISLIKEIKRVLKPNGLLVNEMPDRSRVILLSAFLPIKPKYPESYKLNLIEAQFYGASWEESEQGYPYHKYVWSRTEFEKELNACGFKTIISTSLTPTHVAYRDQLVIGCNEQSLPSEEYTRNLKFVNKHFILPGKKRRISGLIRLLEPTISALNIDTLFRIIRIAINTLLKIFRIAINTLLKILRFTKKKARAIAGIASKITIKTLRRKLSDYLRFKKDKGIIKSQTPIYLTLNHRTNTEAIIVFFVDSSASGWVLEALCKDLIANLSDNCKGVLVYDKELISEIYEYSLLNSLKFKVFCIHPSLLKKVPQSIPQENYIVFYTHNRQGLINNTLVKSLNHSSGLLCMSVQDIPMLVTAGISRSKINHFPLGYCSDTFKNEVNWKSRNIDFVFSMRYVPFSINEHYYLRKNYDFALRLAEILKSKGYTVLFLGRDWDKCETAIDHKTVNYTDYPNVYQNCKVLLMPSLVEGGPLCIPEALASGCKVISSPTGHGLDYDLKQIVLIDSIHNDENLEKWVVQACRMLEEEISSNDYLETINSLEKYSFQSLAKRLEGFI